MAVTQEPVPAQSSAMQPAHQPTQLPRPTPAPRRSSIFGKLLGWLFALGFLAAIVAGVMFAMGTFSSGEKFEESTFKVEKQAFLVTVIEDGNLESARNIDVKCQVAGGSSILSIVADGSFVEEGQEIITLDSSSLEDQINQQKNTFEKARAAKIQAEKDYSVAKISVDEYLKGTFEQELQDTETLITIAEENLRSAKNSLEFTQKMFRKGYISKLEKESQQFNVERAELELKSANTTKDVLVKFTKEKTLEDLNSKVETTKAKMDSEIAAFALEENRLKRFEDQIKNCIVKAPQSGMVVYANEQGRFGSQGVSVEEGATVREQQTLVRLPDLSEMQVKVLVHESKVEQVKIGQRAIINLLGNDYQGRVVQVANQPEATGFFSSGTKEYATIVKVESSSDKLKPGMTAETTILIANVKDAIAVPLASVVEISGKHYCWIKKGTSYEERIIEVNRSNEEFVEVMSGLEEGEVVLKNPRRFAEAAKDKAELEKDSVDKFGSTKTEEGGEKKGGGERGDKSGKKGSWGGSKSGGEKGGASGGPSGGPPSGAGGGPPGGGAGGSRPSLMDNDKDGDGKVSKDEAPAFMKGFFDRIDSNSDGFVEQSEIDEMRKKREAGGGGGGRPPGAGGN